MQIERVVLIGFSGTGKSSVAGSLAAARGWRALDMDAEIERSQGRSIPDIFREDGEAAFRAIENQMLDDALAVDRVVIATGGGVPAGVNAWDAERLGKPGTLVVGLDAAPETILARLERQNAEAGDDAERPMLAGSDPLTRIAHLKQERQAAYDRAHVTLCVDNLTVAEVAQELDRIVDSAQGKPLTLRLDAASAASDIVVAPGALATLGDEIRQRWPHALRVWIVSDRHVGDVHGPAAERAIKDAGIEALQFWVEPGEGSKSLDVAGALYDWLLTGGVERGDIVVALGGGVVGDLAGFVAATVLRGIVLVQVPTSLLAAVDSSVGGKTGINHAAGKNLIGAFLQPPLVLIDTTLLRSLPQRELHSGWGEIVKHAMIQRSTPGGEWNDLSGFLRRNQRQLTNLESPTIDYLVWRNVALKAAVVEQDERESGIRAYLNFGHTLGHAIEAADYHLLHGEAVALGMAAESYLGVLMDTCGQETLTSIGSLLELFGLPANTEFDADIVKQRLMSDKKRVAGRQRYVLPLSQGGVTIRDDVPQSAVDQALAAVNGAYERANA